MKVFTSFEIFMSKSVLGLVILLFCGQALALGSNCLEPQTAVFPTISESTIEFHFCSIPASNNVAVGMLDRSILETTESRTREFESFQISQFEVTQLQYESIMGKKPWVSSNSYDGESALSGVKKGNDYPATYLTYKMAQEFIRILNLMDRTAIYRIPTTDEFEYAANAGAASHYPWGDDRDDNMAYFYNLYQNSQPVQSCPSEEINSIVPGYCANNFGLYHMWGNVEEFTLDESSHSPSIIACGWGWKSAEKFFSEALCRKIPSDERSGNLGLRLVRVPTTKKD